MLFLISLYVFSIKPPAGYGVGYSLDKSATGELTTPVWQGRSIAGPKLRLCEFSAFLEQQTDTESVSKPIGISHEQYNS